MDAQDGQIGECSCKREQDEKRDERCHVSGRKAKLRSMEKCEGVPEVV